MFNLDPDGPKRMCGHNMWPVCIVLGSLLKSKLVSKWTNVVSKQTPSKKMPPCYPLYPIAAVLTRPE